MNWKYIIWGMVTLLIASCTDKDFIEKNLEEEYVTVRASIAKSRACYEDGYNGWTYVQMEIGDSITVNTKLQGSHDYVAYKQEDNYTTFYLARGEYLKNTEGETVYSSYPATTINEGVATLPATNRWKESNCAPFMYAISTINDGMIDLLYNHPYSILKLTLSMVPESLSSVNTSDGDKTIHRLWVESSSGSLGVVEGSFDFESQQMNVTEASNSVEVILDEAYQPQDSLVEKAVYVPILPQEAEVEMSIYALHDTKSGCDTLYSLKKKTPSTGFLAGNVYRLGIYGNDKSSSVIEGNSLSIYLANPGELSEIITDDLKNSITKMRISGFLNGDDIRLIREMAGIYLSGHESDGQLTYLDISDATIVEGGGEYYSGYYTESYIVGTYMFSYTKLTNIMIPKNTIEIRPCAFMEVPLQTIFIPNSVTSIGSTAFHTCTSLTSIEIPDLVQTINSFCFWGCSSLTSVTISGSVTSIRGSAFENCTSLTTIELPNSITSIDNYAFYNVPITTCSIYAETPPKIDSTAFNMDKASATLNVPEGTATAYKESDWATYWGNIVEM